MVSHSQFDNAENLYRAGMARLKQAKAEYEVAGNQAEYAVLRAPQAGVIAKRQVEVGQVVAAGQTVFTLAADALPGGGPPFAHLRRAHRLYLQRHPGRTGSERTGVHRPWRTLAAGGAAVGGDRRSGAGLCLADRPG
ncbi:hypothetical protein WR25_26056 [Diploscapter pachys]|uniref:Membrane fusion protein biotin-lipoyl like domain-containing protein n=1 Tax=Diploscapter pachys TaxID=2018661 RepID=A0A2A2K7E1_9BILA|nr:hypothetical protein WR25_26056 [Diploscapter pachys]